MSSTLRLVPEKDVSGVFITEALESRPMRSSDAGDEKNAILAIAAAMSEMPGDILPRLVELAMRLTGARSAGLSLYEPQPAPGVFRWRHVCGLLTPFENATTPRHDSPCGVALDSNRPTLSTHPERVYGWIAEAGIVVPEVLLVPLYAGSGNPLGTLWIVAEHEGHFHKGHAVTATELAHFAGLAVKMAREEQRLRVALDDQELLTKEMSHRLKNLFAMTEGMIRSSARSSETVDDMATALSGRLHALASAHLLVQGRAGALTGENLTDLGGLIAKVARVHDDERDEVSRVTINGPRVECGQRAANSVALTIHELATNAAKYGALSNRSGRVDVTWQCEGEFIELNWREIGGPPVSSKRGRDGFGTTLIARTIAGQFHGSVDYDWLPEGLTVAFRLAVDMLKR